MAASASAIVESTSDSEASIRKLHFELLYTKIAIEYLHPNVDDGLPATRFRAKCREYITVSSAQESVEKLLLTLESERLVGIGNYDILKEITSFDVRILNEINSTELKIQSHGGTIQKRNSKRKLSDNYYVQRGISLISRNCFFPFHAKML